MTVRFKLALTIIATGVLTALLVIGTVLYAFQRFERETTFQRANAFLARVTMNVDDLLELHQQQPGELNTWMRNLLLYEPDSQLYLLDAQGTVLSSTGSVQLAAGFRVALAPVQRAADAAVLIGTAYVMGEDPERMTDDAVVAARALRRNMIRSDAAIAGYLYLVCHRPTLPGLPWQALSSSFALPALALILAVVALTTALAAAVIASVTRPLQRLTTAVAAYTFSPTDGIHATDAGAPLPALGASLPPRTADEFGQLTAAFETMLGTLRMQWQALQRLDHFRREGVSNLSHDLRSPLTATVACLETLEARWAGAGVAGEEQRLVEVALRNTRNAARLVRSLGDLAKLDEPSFRLRRETVDVGELLADIGLRFAARAAQSGIRLAVAPADALAAMALADIDIELFERAVANLIDNALKYCPTGAQIELDARCVDDRVRVRVSDTGPGIAAADRPHLFERFYQSRANTAPAAGDGGKGLGLAIVQRIAELHQGQVELTSPPGGGTTVTLCLPAAAAPARADT